MNTTNITNAVAGIAGKTYIALAIASYAIPWTILTASQILQHTKAKLLDQGRKTKHQN